MFDDLNLGIRAAIVAGIIGLLSLGAYTVNKAFKTPDAPATANNEPMDFSGPAKKVTRASKKKSDFDGVNSTRRPASIRGYDGTSPSYAELPRTDGGPASN